MIDTADIKILTHVSLHDYVHNSTVFSEPGENTLGTRGQVACIFSE
jgi:hypothetical protein